MREVRSVNKDVYSPKPLHSCLCELLCLFRVGYINLEARAVPSERLDFVLHILGIGPPHIRDHDFRTLTGEDKARRPAQLTRSSHDYSNLSVEQRHRDPAASPDSI